VTLIKAVTEHKDIEAILGRIRVLPADDAQATHDESVAILEALQMFFNEFPVFDVFINSCIITKDFLTSPASTMYHGAFRGGLTVHSLKVLRRIFLLSGGLLPPESEVKPEFALETLCQYSIAALAHDLCKVGCYILDTKNVKVNGVWEQQPYYKWNPEYTSMGHGNESLIRLREVCRLPLSLEMAIVYHMGAWGLGPDGTRELRAAMDKYPDILLFQAADQAAASLDKA
jgi:hypothetical protein